MTTSTVKNDELRKRKIQESIKKRQRDEVLTRGLEREVGSNIGADNKKGFSLDQIDFFLKIIDNLEQWSSFTRFYVPAGDYAEKVLSEVGKWGILRTREETRIRRKVIERKILKNISDKPVKGDFVSHDGGPATRRRLISKVEIIEETWSQELVDCYLFTDSRKLRKKIQTFLKFELQWGDPLEFKSILEAQKKKLEDEALKDDSKPSIFTRIFSKMRKRKPKVDTHQPGTAQSVMRKVN